MKMVNQRSRWQIVRDERSQGHGVALELRPARGVWASSLVAQLLAVDSYGGARTIMACAAIEAET